MCCSADEGSVSGALSQSVKESVELGIVEVGLEAEVDIVLRVVGVRSVIHGVIRLFVCLLLGKGIDVHKLIEQVLILIHVNLLVGSNGRVE